MIKIIDMKALILQLPTTPEKHKPVYQCLTRESASKHQSKLQRYLVNGPALLINIT